MTESSNVRFMESNIEGKPSQGYWSFMQHTECDENGMSKMKKPKVMTEWISVKDRLPKKLECVLITWDGLQFQPHAYFDHEKNKWQDVIEVIYDGEEVIDDPLREITHWMPLPNPPEQLPVPSATDQPQEP
jgi:hypothetical protein